MEQTIAKEIAILLGEENMLADYFSNTPFNNMYSQIYKYDIHNPMSTLNNENIKISKDFDTSRKSLKDIIKYTDIINSETDFNNKGIAFNNVHEVLYNLMEQQFEYAKEPGNEHELKQVNKRFKELYKVFPKFKDNEKLNLANINPQLAKQVDRQESIKEFFNKIKTNMQEKIKSFGKKQTKALPEHVSISSMESIDKPDFSFGSTQPSYPAGKYTANTSDLIAPTPQSMQTTEKEDTSRSQSEQALIDSIRGMSEADYTKYIEIQRSDSQKNWNEFIDETNTQGKSIQNLHSNLGGLDR